MSKLNEKRAATIQNQVAILSIAISYIDLALESCSDLDRYELHDIIFHLKNARQLSKNKRLWKKEKSSSIKPVLIDWLSGATFDT